ncbi:outer membrane beta-barrel family protein [Nonlabens xiamenensis]|uniref:outer membrane beta-barrel family protein n=1 Tax=Nonlabens xiamenensis TaxID=2341043 RepID=UPI000F615694|nr:outer membrane beta-barrel family protein [Nonlabens xiamenensis]
MKYFPYFFLFIFLHSNAQNDLTGQLRESLSQSQTTQPIEYANIVLLKMPDSTFYQATISDEKGKFAFASLPSGDYQLLASSVGYVTLSRKLSLTADTDLGILEMATDQQSLDEITLTAIKPTVEKRPDRLVFQVENTVLSTGMADNILKRTPGVVEMNGSYMVQNSPAIIYINNKRVYLTSSELNALLSGYSADNVKSVEVITNPPAQYDAEGVAVININTSKGISLGYKGSVQGKYTIDKFAKYQIGLSQFYKNDWLNVYANYNYNPRKDFKREESQIGFFNPDGTRSERWFMEFENVDRSDAHNLNAIVDISLNDKNSISFSGNLNSNQNNEANTNNQTLILENDATSFSGFDTQTDLERDRTNGFINAAWNSQLNDQGASLSLEGNYIFNNRDITQDLFSTFFDENQNTTGTNSFFTDILQDIDIYTGKLDFSTALGSYDFKGGLKYSRVDSSSEQEFFDTDNGQVINPAQSDLFLYDETIYSAYAQIDRSWSSWSLAAGLRVEQTDVEGDSRSLGLVNTQEYLEFFPNIALTKTANANNSYTLSYRRSIERPRYGSLNPFSFFVNDANFSTGNPNLQPAFSNKVNVGWNHKNTWFVDAYFLHTEDMLAILPFQNNTTNELNSQNANLNYELQYSVDAAYYSYVNNSWYLGASGSLFYMENEFVAQQSGGVDQQLNTTGIYLNAFNRFNLADDRSLSMDLQVGYLSSILVGSYKFENMLTTNLSFAKRLWDDRALLTLEFNDIFLSQNQPLSSRYLNQDNFYLALPETQTIAVGFTYKFGNFRLDNNEVTAPEEEERTNQKSVGF